MKIKRIKKPEQLTKENIAGKLKGINNDTGNWPNWCSIKTGNRQNNGKAVFGSLDHIKVVISRYLLYLQEQDGRNKILLNKMGGNHPDASYTIFCIIEKNKP